jgi:hypothetical protein
MCLVLCMLSGSMHVTIHVVPGFGRGPGLHSAEALAD